MEQQRETCESGFTLIEVALVVLIVALLSSVALSQHGKYLAKSRRTEGIIALKDLDRLQATYFSMHDRYAATVSDLKFALDKGRLEGPNSYRGPYYRYSTATRGEGRGYVATAVGDIDGDTFEDVLLIWR